MKIVLRLTDAQNRDLIIGPFSSVDDAESFGESVSDKPPGWAPLNYMVTTIVSPTEYLSTDDITTLDIDPAPKQAPDNDNNPTHKMSGNYYVPMMMRDTDPRGNKPRPVRIRTINRCTHLHEVCTDCLESWEEDHIVYFRRTQGGRRLALAAGRDPNEPFFGTDPT